MSKSYFILAGILTIASVPIFAATLPDPTSFSPGQTISSSSMNSQLSSIVSEVNAKETRVTNLETKGAVHVFSTPGSYSLTVPSGVSQVLINATGGGGGGGGGNGSSCSGLNAAQPGGGGAYVYSFQPVTPGDSLSIVVGAGGTAGTKAVSCPNGSGATNGATGSSTTIGDGAAWTVTAGAGGGGGASPYSACTPAATAGVPGLGAVSPASSGYLITTAAGGMIAGGAAGAPGTPGVNAANPSCTNGGSGGNGIVILQFF